MIKLYRKIRQQLLREGKTSKYLTYALGEIVLVVIGILIALSINNWNQERLASKKESVYLTNLEVDLEQQLSSIDIQLSYEQKYIDTAHPLLNTYFKVKKFTLDSASSQSLNILSSRKTFVKTDPTYQDLISTGNIALIKDQELRKTLLQYYNERERYEKIIQNNNTLRIDETFSYDIIHSVYLGPNDQRLFNISNELLRDPEREMILINLIDHRATMAEIHLGFMNELKVKTRDMLGYLKNSKS